MVLRFGTHSSISFKEGFLPPVGLRETEKLNVYVFLFLFLCCLLQIANPLIIVSH